MVLPSSSAVYGGKRFDQEGEISQKWKDFGKDSWVLPLIELAREAKKRKERNFALVVTSILIHWRDW